MTDSVCNEKVYVCLFVLIVLYCQVFGANKNTPTDYAGQRSASSIVDTAINYAKQLAQARLSGGGGSSGGGSSGGRVVALWDAIFADVTLMLSLQKTADPQDVIELTDSNFDSLVLGSTDMWLVEFFAPWCVVSRLRYCSRSD